MATTIVVTGMGVISPYGVGTTVLWENLMAGETGLKPLTSFDTSHVQCRVGGQYSDFRPESYLSPRIVRKVDRFSTLGLIAAQHALQDAGLLLNDAKPTWSQQEIGSALLSAIIWADGNLLNANFATSGNRGRVMSVPTWQQPGFQPPYREMYPFSLASKALGALF